MLLMVPQSDEKRGQDSYGIQANLQLGQLLRKNHVGESDGKYWSQLLNDTDHAQTEKGHRVVADELGEDALEDAEGERREVVKVHIIHELLLGIPSHVDEKNKHGTEPPIE